MHDSNCKGPNSFNDDLKILVERYTKNNDKSIKGIILTAVIIGDDHNHAMVANALNGVSGSQLATALIDNIQVQGEMVKNLNIEIQRPHKSL